MSVTKVMHFGAPREVEKLPLWFSGVGMLQRGWCAIHPVVSPDSLQYCSTGMGCQPFRIFRGEYSEYLRFSVLMLVSQHFLAVLLF